MSLCQLRIMVEGCQETQKTLLTFVSLIIGFVSSDHRIVECATTYQVDNTLGNTEEGSCSSEPGPSFHTLNFFSDDVDWEGLEDELSSHDWDLEFQQLGLEDVLRHFLSTSLDISLSHVPAKKMGDNRKCSSKIPRERKNLMRRRRRINMQLRKTTAESRRLKQKQGKLRRNSRILTDVQELLKNTKLLGLSRKTQNTSSPTQESSAQ